MLTVKGSLRRAKNGRALDCSAPFRPDRNRDGRLRREHFTDCCTKTKKALTGLDKVAPYQNGSRIMPKPPPPGGGTVTRITAVLVTCRGCGKYGQATRV